MRRKKKKQQCKVGREEEGSSSNQFELATFLLALRDTLKEALLLYLFDNRHCRRQSIGGLVKVERQRWWGHLMRIFWQQPSRYYEKGLQQDSNLLGQSESASRRTSE